MNLTGLAPPGLGLGPSLPLGANNLVAPDAMDISVSYTLHRRRYGLIISFYRTTIPIPLESQPPLTPVPRPTVSVVSWLSFSRCSLSGPVAPVSANYEEQPPSGLSMPSIPAPEVVSAPSAPVLLSQGMFVGLIVIF